MNYTHGEHGIGQSWRVHSLRQFESWAVREHLSSKSELYSCTSPAQVDIVKKKHVSSEHDLISGGNHLHTNHLEFLFGCFTHMFQPKQPQHPRKIIYMGSNIELDFYT